MGKTFGIALVPVLTGALPGDGGLTVWGGDVSQANISGSVDHSC